MTQYFELAAQQMESEANRLSGIGEHGHASKLWAEAARIGTRIPEEPEGVAVAVDGKGHRWATVGNGEWYCLDHDHELNIAWNWDLLIEECVPPLKVYCKDIM